MIDQIQPVSDPVLLERLETYVITALMTGVLDEFDLGPPGIVDWHLIDTFRFHFTRRRAEQHPDLRLSDLINGMRSRGELERIDLSFLRSRQIKALDVDGQAQASWSIWRSLAGEFTIGAETFALDEGEFYRVEADYLVSLNTEVNALAYSGTALPCSEPAMREAQYNKHIVASLGGSALLLDGQIVHTAVRGGIEVCDVLTLNRELIHVKRHLGSSDLSHLFAQGRVSAELLQERGDFRLAVAAKPTEIGGSEPFRFFAAQPIVTSEFEVVYAIVAKWRDRPLSDALPFFSKVNLRKTSQDLRNRGYRVSCATVSASE